MAIGDVLGYIVVFGFLFLALPEGDRSENIQHMHVYFLVLGRLQWAGNGRNRFANKAFLGEHAVFCLYNDTYILAVHGASIYGFRKMDEAAPYPSTFYHTADFYYPCLDRPISRFDPIWIFSGLQRQLSGD